MSRWAAARMFIMGAIVLDCLTLTNVGCACLPATVAACASGDEILLDCWLDASEAQVAVALRVASAVCFSCAASASAMCWLRRVFPCRVAGRPPLRLPATASLSFSEELFQEVMLGCLAFQPLPFSCLQLRKRNRLLQITVQIGRRPLRTPLARFPCSSQWLLSTFSLSSGDYELS